MITIDQLTYTYPNSDRVALQDVSWQVAAGEFVLVAGPSGSGKSTLLRCLNGLVPHFTGGTVSGQIVVDGLDALALGPHTLSRHVGFVLQNPEAQAVLDRVEPEIAFGLENAAVPPQEMRVRVEEVLDLLDLTPLRERPLTTLSGGERQRVAIATALALRPQILVLDEPTSQLDPQSAEEVLRALVRLNEDLGLTIILAEHRLERVLRYVDRITYLENGRITVDDFVQPAIAQIPQLPPLVRLGRELGWSPLPLTVKEGRRFAREGVKGGGGERVKAQPTRSPLHPFTPSLLTADNLSYAYNGRSALNQVSLQVNAGETVAVMGRNGAGKSTLLKCLMGLLKPQTGEVVMNGRVVNGRAVAEISREAAYLPQNPDDLLFAETVVEELTITLRNHNLLHQNGVANLLDRLGLAPLAEAYPRDLSVGQRQRVALGAVTITRPKLLMLDEPTRGLDYEAKQTLVTIWQQWLAEGMGLLLVTHDVELVAQVADRVIIMSQGEVIASGPTAEILATSPLFAPQISRLFPDSGWLTVEDALAGVKGSRGAGGQG
ncbi:MAG: energy-coupling factor ABC transporter ATP-binding protein [Ardenticatenaceae bacterium]|nr:energy-coupling factor ABC transporter ATP-binding protein [Ardenticatenaceae bacterium]